MSEYEKKQNANDKDQSANDKSIRERETYRLIILVSSVMLALFVIVVAVVVTYGRTQVVASEDVGGKVKPLSSDFSQTETVTPSSFSTPVPTPVITPTPAPTPSPKPTPVAIRPDLDPEKPMVALTFDDGPYDVVDKRILKVLKKYDGRATFFVLGSRVSSYKKDLKNIYKQGCQVASHTYSHKNLTELSKKAMKEEVKKANKAIKKIIGVNPGLLRCPYGSTNKLMKETIKMPLIAWNVDSEDWKSRNADTVYKRCKDISDGDIILMHDIYESTADAVEKLVPKLHKKGVQFVTVEELFYYKGKKLKNGKTYYNAKDE